jgi:hypothetical protein
VIEFFAHSAHEKKFETGGIAGALRHGASLELKQTEIELTPQASAARSFIWPRFLWTVTLRSR